MTGLAKTEGVASHVISNNEALAQLSHEICNHLTQIMLASNLLQLDLEEILSGEQQHQFKGIDEGAQRIRALLARLRRVTEPASGQVRRNAANT